VRTSGKGLRIAVSLECSTIKNWLASPAIQVKTGSQALQFKAMKDIPGAQDREVAGDLMVTAGAMLSDRPLTPR
jgi:hypothetical protein